jgi:hypothetical protein
MDASAAHELIEEMRAVRRRTRGDRRATSVPLVVFGAITVLDALLRTVVGPLGTIAPLVIAPAGFAAVALYYRRREIARGVGGRTGAYVLAAVLTLLILPLVIVFGAYALVGVALLVIAVRQRNLYLGVWAVVYGVLGGLESIFFLSNRLYTVADALGFVRAENGYFWWAPTLVYGALGALLIGAGLYAQRSEVASS